MTPSKNRSRRPVRPSPKRETWGVFAGALIVAGALAEQIKTDKTLADKVAANPSYLTRAGAVLIKVNDEIIGVIGVGGARGSDKDEQYALAGLQKVQARLK